MDYKKLSFGLGLFSLALGAAVLFAPRRITTALEANGKEGLVKMFGARELVAGGGLLMAPAHATKMWGRVAGDGMDLIALTLAVRRAPRNRAVWGSVALVLGVTTLDVMAALGLDRTTGKTWPVRENRSGTAAHA